MSEIFTLRFHEIGSLYADPDNPEDVVVGPVVCTTLYGDPQGEEGRPYVHNVERGPFPTVGLWLSSIPKHELAFMDEHRDFALSEALDYSDTDTMQEFERARHALQELSELALTYCGPLGRLTQEFSLHHHDFRLSNVHVDPSTGAIEGLLDWEATHTAALWACARLPAWLTEAGDSNVQNPDERRRLRAVFLDAASAEWREAFERGRDWRVFQNVCEFNWVVWGQERMLAKLAAYRVQAAQFPGVPVREGELQDLDLSSGVSSPELDYTSSLVLSPTPVSRS